MEFNPKIELTLRNLTLKFSEINHYRAWYGNSTIGSIPK